MNQSETNRIVLKLMRCFLNGELFKEGLSEEQRSAVFALANKHDVAHLIGELLEKPDENFVQAKRKAIYRYVQQDYERQRIYTLFDIEQIPYIPLKGSVIRSLYHQEWQRTSCDIDILVRDIDLERAERTLKDKLDFRFRKKSAHDISLLSASGVHLELHYAFDEKEVPLDAVWCDATPVSEETMQLAMSGELFLFHHIAHMAKHFKLGGCGLRPFVDLWFIKRKLNYNGDKLNELLQNCGLKLFFDAVFQLLEFWFGAGESSPLLDAMTEYILPAGAYGSVKNKVAIGQLNTGSKSHYFLSRLIQPREALEYIYPKLKKYGWLLPLCQIHRWYKLLADGKLKRIAAELSANGSMDDTYRNDVGALMKELELQ